MLAVHQTKAYRLYVNLQQCQLAQQTAAVFKHVRQLAYQQKPQWQWWLDRGHGEVVNTLQVSWPLRAASTLSSLLPPQVRVRTPACASYSNSNNTPHKHWDVGPDSG